MFAALKHTVKPDKIDEYKELMTKFATACKEHNYPFSYSAWQSSHPDFYYFYAIKDYNAVQELNSESWKIVPHMEADFAKKLFETIDSWEQFFIKSIDSLHYMPENPPVIGADLPYAEWWVNHHQPWTGWKYRNTFQKANEMSAKANFEYPIHRFRSDVGMNGPAIITIFWGKNAADLYAQSSKNWSILGEEVQNMIRDFRSTTRKFEKIPFWYQKDMAYSAE